MNTQDSDNPAALRVLGRVIGRNPLGWFVAVAIVAVLGFFIFKSENPPATSKRPSEIFRPPDRTDENQQFRYYLEGYGTGNERGAVAEALLDREQAERVLEARALFDGDPADARKHGQRAADYMMAAKIYVKTGKYPPGFDADLATK